MSSKFGALSKLNTVRTETEESRKQESEKIETPVNSKARNLETEEPWVALGTEVQKTTKRRLKAYAGANGGKLKELVDQAITAYLDHLEN